MLEIVRSFRSGFVALLAVAGHATGALAAPAPMPPASEPAGFTPVTKEYAAPAASRLGMLAPGTGIPVGQKVPDLEAVDLQGKRVSLSSLYGKTPILLVFYRGGWCPYCNTEIHALTAAFAEFGKRGIVPVAVSVDRPDVEAKTKARYDIPFPVLSDRDAAMIRAFHVARTVPDEELAQMKAYGIDLESYAGGTHHQMAIPALFLIDRGGIVRWAHSDPEYKVRPSTAQILSAIDAAHLPRQ